MYLFQGSSSPLDSFKVGPPSLGPNSQLIGISLERMRESIPIAKVKRPPLGLRITIVFHQSFVLFPAPQTPNVAHRGGPYATWAPILMRSSAQKSDISYTGGDLLGAYHKGELVA